MNKLLLIYKNTIQIIFSNKKRLILSSLGIALSAFLFIFLQLVMHLPQQLSFADYRNFPQDAILINGDFKSNDLKNLNSNHFKYTCISSPIEFTIINRPNIEVTAYGVNQNFLDFPVRHSILGDSLEITQLLYGRTFNNDDLVRQQLVIIINETAASILFNNDEVVGNVIHVYDNNNQKFNFIVIGVISDTPSIYVENNKINQQIKSGKTPIIDLHCYIPETVAHYFADSKIDSIVMRTPYEPSSIMDHIKTLLGVSNIQIHNYKQHFERFSQETSDTRNALIVIQTIVMIFSSINLTVILLFSLKDRVFEIGIKKALGASNEDIMIQFQMEAFIIGLFGSIIGVLLGAYLSALFALKLSFDIGVLIVNINIRDYIYNIVFIQLFVLIASLIPCYVAANKNILIALRVD